MKRTKKQKTSLRIWLYHQARLFLVPHQANHYRPHMIRRYSLLMVLVVVVGLQVGYNAMTSGSVLGSEASVSTEILLADTNAERARYDIMPLKASDKLSQAAYLKASDMFQNQYWDHVSPDGTTPWQWLANVDYNYTYAGENLAKNFTTAEATTTAWMASSTHRSNLLNRHYTEVGFAVVAGVLHNKPTTLIVALYGTPASSPVVIGAQGSSVAAWGDGKISLLTRLGIAVQSVTPAALGSMVILLLVAAASLTAHFYRNKLPKKLRESWYRHHGLIKAGGLLSIGFIILVLYGGGQI